MEKKVTTYGELKIRKEELRNEMDEEGDYTNIDEYRQIVQSIKDAELCLLWSVTPNEAFGELVKPKARKRVKYVAIVISVVIVVWLLVGCHTINGVGRDLSAWSSPYIEHQEK